jgi:drug/metabolite transporter (DMT)-like permease
VKFDRGILAALGAAALFGLSTPLAKPLAAHRHFPDAHHRHEH